MFIYVDGSKESFATVGDFLQGARAIAALGDLPASTPARLVYRYAGPSGQRTFCQVLKGINKVYTREDITRMNRLNYISRRQKHTERRGACALKWE